MDYREFISKDKSMLIAPAGYGKTHTIIECLRVSDGRQLVLTHTHAGIASINEKIRKEKVPASKFSIETISGFTQKYVLAFCRADEIPSQDDAKAYHPFIIRKAIELFAMQPIRGILKSTYAGLFVDEYQDCTLSQHELVTQLCGILPTRILGDHMQGIFDFNDDLVDLTDPSHLGGFLENRYTLDQPKRWEASNAKLGEDIKAVRGSLERGEQIDFSKHESIELHVHKEIEVYDMRSDYYKKLGAMRNLNGVLLIHPDNFGLAPRKKITSLFNNAFRLLESVDDPDFYALAREVDACKPEDALKCVSRLAYALFNSTALKTWLNERGFIRKSQEAEQKAIAPVRAAAERFARSMSFLDLATVLRMLRRLPKVVCYRYELFHSLVGALENAHHGSLSAYESMVAWRNKMRRIGRKAEGRSFGTTLLTKGLEFDTVVILNAQKFTCPKNLYVAISRAKKRLIIFSSTPIISPYKLKG
ncbi:UvrD-helicase domain-containing protein [Nemorincola caseinilytica]